MLSLIKQLYIEKNKEMLAYRFYRSFLNKTKNSPDMDEKLNNFLVSSYYIYIFKIKLCMYKNIETV